MPPARETLTALACLCARLAFGNVSVDHAALASAAGRDPDDDPGGGGGVPSFVTEWWAGKEQDRQWILKVSAPPNWSEHRTEGVRQCPDCADDEPR